MPSSTLDTQAADSVQHATEIKATNKTHSEDEYKLRLVAWGAAMREGDAGFCGGVHFSHHHFRPV
eukprot:2646597-Lingulodinium_polyedra.AAC.1